MFINQALFHDENVGSVFISLPWMLEILFITSSKSSQISNEIVKFWAAETARIFTILYL